jgi:nucleotide-binding universal stress UspA family protein
MTTRPVVVAVDGSGESLQAVEWAVSEAQLHDTPLRIASVASLPKMGVLGLQPERDAVLGYVRAQRDRVLATAAARAAQMAPGLLIDTDPIEGQAARAVTESGSGALMLVTGFCGTGAFAATVLGSVAQYAADHASCPVVVVRDQAAAAHRLVGVGLGDLEGCADALVRVRGGGPAQGPLMAIHAWHAPQASITWPGDRFLPPGLNVAAADAARQLALLMDQ